MEDYVLFSVYIRWKGDGIGCQGEMDEHLYLGSYEDRETAWFVGDEYCFENDCEDGFFIQTSYHGR